MTLLIWLKLFSLKRIFQCLHLKVYRVRITVLINPSIMRPHIKKNPKFYLEGKVIVGYTVGYMIHSMTLSYYLLEKRKNKLQNGGRET